MKVKAIFASLLLAAVMMLGASASVSAADRSPVWSGGPVAAEHFGSRGHADRKQGDKTDGPKEHKHHKHHRKHHHKHHHKDGGPRTDGGK